jgi:hypothetical protein
MLRTSVSAASPRLTDWEVRRRRSRRFDSLPDEAYHAMGQAISEVGMRTIRRIMVVALASSLMMSVIQSSPAAAHGTPCTPSDTFALEGAFKVHLTAKWSCNENHYQMKIRAYVQKNLRPGLDPWVNAGYTAVNVKNQTGFIIADPGGVLCTVSRGTRYAAWRIVIDFAHVWKQEANGSITLLPDHSTEGWVGPTHLYGCY